MPLVYVAQTIDDIFQFATEIPDFFIVGKGSNTVIDPATCQSPILQLSPTLFAPEVSKTSLRVGAGVRVHDLMHLLQTHGLSGLEFSAGVPASIGGMIAMNFGCWGKEISHYVRDVRIVDEDGKERWITGSELDFGYRTSRFHHEKWIILEAIFSLDAEDPAVIKHRIATAISTRLGNQPLRDKTFGSVFKNPEGTTAGHLLDIYGLKGYEKNGVKFSEKHANFMVNLGDATIESCKELIDIASTHIHAKTGISLELEVRFLP